MTVFLATCDNYRIMCSKRYQGEVRCGYQASKKRYFHGLELYLMITAQGRPVEFFLTLCLWSDTRALKWDPFDLPKGALVTVAKACNDYSLCERKTRNVPCRLGFSIWLLVIVNSSKPLAA